MIVSFSLILSGEITGVPTSVNWIVGNLDSAFYYRVNYDNQTWEELKNQLYNDHEVFNFTNLFCCLQFKDVDTN